VLAAVEASTSTSANAEGTDGTRILAMTTSEDKRRARSRPFLWLGWAAAAALALVAVLVNGRLRQTEQDLTEARAEVDGLRLEVADRDRVLAVIGARDSRTIRLVTATPEAPQFRAYWSESSGLVLTGANVPAARAGRTMQLWIVPKQGSPISAGVFAPGPRGEVLLIASNTPPPDGAQALAISDEPEGGSAQPTTTPAWVGTVGGF
jgi:anti-sigma-K factor RskA